METKLKGTFTITIPFQELFEFFFHWTFQRKIEFSFGIVIKPAERAVGAAMKTTHETPMRIEPMWANAKSSPTNLSVWTTRRALPNVISPEPVKEQKITSICLWYINFQVCLFFCESLGLGAFVCVWTGDIKNKYVHKLSWKLISYWFPLKTIIFSFPRVKFIFYAYKFENNGGAHLVFRFWQ